MQSWTLAEKFDIAHKLAKGGGSVEEIMQASRLTQETAELIWGKANPHYLDPFGRLKRGVKP